MSRIFYGGKFYDYPLRAGNALRNMGLIRATSCVLSYAKARAFPIRNPKNYEEWVTNRFGAKLFETFFKSYTEKVWGIPCNKIGADWAAQRIKNFSLGEAIRNALFGKKSDSTVTTLIDEFKYPRLGPGQLWERCAEKVVAMGWELRMKTRVTGVNVGGGGVESVEVMNGSGVPTTLAATNVFSSMPLRTLLNVINPSPPREVLSLANALKYRDFLTVVLILDSADVFPDNWIYIHSPQVRVGRIQNFRSWSPAMVPDEKTSSLGMEYFVNEGDDVWTMADDALIEMAYRELGQIGLANGRLVKGYVVRAPKAYPVYDTGYQTRLAGIREWLGTLKNLFPIGRNGQHRYNNQDHSMATALIAAANVVGDQSRDVWAVNEDAEYHEVAKTERGVPQAVADVRT